MILNETKTNSQSSINNQNNVKIRSRFQSSANETMSTFPKDFIAEILSRLPVKSLLRFRCVSKSWCSLISSKYFIQLHLKNSNKRIISIVQKPSKRLINYSLESLLGRHVADAVDFEYPIHSSKNFVSIVGCCNGVACIANNGNQFFLWNSSTRKYKKLADVNDKLEQGRFSTMFGFGFDKFSDDYKIVRILTGRTHDVRYDYRMKIYSMRSDSWKGIDAFEDSISIHGSGKFVNGKLHWLSIPGLYSEWDIPGLDSEWDIVSFDLGSETFASVEQPSYGKIGFCRSLGVLEGCLCVLCDCEIWILKQYGVRESWEKVVTVPYLDDPWNRPYLTRDLIPDLTLLCVGPKGEIFLLYESGFMVYDPKVRSFKCSKIRNFHSFWNAEVYTESLISLDDGESDARLRQLLV